MDKQELMIKFQEFLKKRFPNRPAPISKDVRDIEPKGFNDSRFDRWRKM